MDRNDEKQDKQDKEASDVEEQGARVHIREGDEPADASDEPKGSDDNEVDEQMRMSDRNLKQTITPIGSPFESLR